MNHETHYVSNLDESIRISDYAVGVFDRVPSKKGIKKALKKQLILLNERTAHSGDWLKNGDLITLLPEPIIHAIFKCTIDVIYEDDFIALVHKPPALLTSGNRLKTLQNSLSFNLKDSQEKGAFTVPKVLHRLDYETSGLLLVAKTHSSFQFLQEQFINRKITKTYLAICAGGLHGEGCIDEPIDKKIAVTKYKVLQQKESLKYGTLTLVRLQPETGRTHQIRKHLSHIGCPILGDKLYGNKYSSKYTRSHLLLASSLQFEDYVSRKMVSFELEMEERMAVFF